MTASTLDYRLRIRNDDDTADLLSYTTIPGDNCYTLKAPSAGDGQSFDPVLGTFVLGTYTYTVVDALTDAVDNIRAVSSYMADIQNRYRLISHRAIVEFSEDGGDSWLGYLSGFINQIQKMGALLYEFAIGDAQRVEKGITLFKEKSGSFDKMSCLFGGPVRGGFGLIRDYGPWTVKTKGHYAGLVVQFHFVSGYVRRSADNLFLNFPTGGFAYVEGDWTDYEQNKVNELVKPFRTDTPEFLAAGIGSSYPRIECRVEDTNGALIGLFMLLNSRDPAFVVGAGWGAGDLHGVLTGGDVCLYWPASGINPDTGLAWPTQPTTGTNIRIYAYMLDVTETSPVHVSGHPVALVALAYDDAGIAYDAASVTSCSDAIGANIGIALRPTAPMTLDAFVNTLMGVFQFSAKQMDGKRVFFPTAIRVDTTPALTCSASDIVDAGAVIFDQDEKDIINSVSLSVEHYELWAPEKFGKDSSRPIDEIVTTPVTVTVTTDDLAIYQAHQITFAIKGEIYITQMRRIIFFQFVSTAEVPTRDFLLARARGAGSIFDRRQRGSITGNLVTARGASGGMQAAQLGDEVYTTIPWQQNKNGIGGNRIVQIVKRTEAPVGPVFVVEDSGTTAQPATLPTFTFAKDSGTDPKRYAIATVTNAAALITEGDNVRIELGNGTAPTSFTLLVVLTLEEMAGGYTAFRLPRMDAGSSHAMRMRSESAGIRPSTYTTPIAVTLDALTAPSSLSIIGQAGDGSVAVLTWVNGESDVPVEIRFRVTGALAWRTVVMPAGSTSTAIATLELSTAYDFDVRHHEAPPYDGVSPSASATFTTGATGRTLLPPDNPSAFSGSYDAASGSFINDGTYGLEVTAAEFPEAIQFEVAIETSPGSGTYGAYVDPTRSQRGAAQQPARTRFTALAPSDGLRRRLHAKAVMVGCTDSPWCDAVDVLPYIPLRPTDYPVPAPAITLSYSTIQQAGSLQAIISVNFATPTQSQYADMEYKVRSRVPGAVWSSFSRVPGTKLGPDTIAAQFGLEYGVTPVTVTAKDGVRSTDGVEVTITIPASPADGVVSATADSDTMNITVVPNAIAAFYRVYSASYTATPSPIPASVELPENFIGPDRDVSITYLELPVDATNTDRVTTLVFYDQNGARGVSETVNATYDPAATPPGTPTLSTVSNAANAVQIQVVLDGAAAAGDVIVFKRDGVQIQLHTVTSGEATANAATLTDASAVAGATYVYTATTHRISDGLFSAESSGDSVTVAAGGTLPTPSATTAIDSGDPCASFLVTPHAGTGTPSGTVYDIYTSSSSGGTYTLQASGIANGSATSVGRPGGQHGTSYTKVKARKTGYTTSAFSSVASIGGVPTGTMC